MCLLLVVAVQEFMGRLDKVLEAVEVREAA
jgi:hypothetical protein